MNRKRPRLPHTSFRTEQKLDTLDLILILLFLHQTHNNSSHYYAVLKSHSIFLKNVQ